MEVGKCSFFIKISTINHFLLHRNVLTAMGSSHHVDHGDAIYFFCVSFSVLQRTISHFHIVVRKYCTSIKCYEILQIEVNVGLCE